MQRKKVIIMGAAGRDFHNFNTFFRTKEEYEVVAFTAFQIPDIEGRTYPPELSGSLYPEGIPIYAEEELPDLIKKHDADLVIFSYSDVPHEYVMHRASLANACGANFMLLGARDTMIKSTKPVISICAARTGSGKSQTSRKVVQYFKDQGLRVAAIRHPMPYGDLSKQISQRFATYEDFAKHECTIEEREEYEPYIEMGLVIYAGVDYEVILREAEKEADIIIWDGGNNDLPFYVPDLHIVVVDPHRPGHELSYYPGEANFRMADVIVINKMDTAPSDGIASIKKNIREINPDATVIEADSPLTVDKPSLIKGKKVLVIEDGPTLTHGEMRYGAGIVAAKNNDASQIVDPRPYAVGSIKATFDKYTHLENLLPAMGYGERQIQELEMTINSTPCDAVIIGTPVDLGKLLEINKPYTRVKYTLQERGSITLADVLAKIMSKQDSTKPAAAAQDQAAYVRTGSTPESRETGDTSSSINTEPNMSDQPAKVRHMLHLKDFTKDELREILELAKTIKANPKEYWYALDHKTLIMLFQKSSTRTRLSFETGMAQLGGHGIYLDWRTTQLDKASLKDETRCLDRYGDIIAARLKYHKDLAEIAKYSQVPVINMLCEKYHPCQSLGDILTIEEHLGDVKGKKIVFTGIGNNVSNTLIDAGTKLGAEVVLAAPEKDPVAIDLELESAAKATGLYRETTNLVREIADADVIYTDTWINMEYFTDPKFADEKERRVRTFMPYQVSAHLLAKTGSDARIMHCLAAHEGWEITRDAIDHDNSIIFDQAKNRLHIQKAIMIWLLRESDQL